MFYRAVKRVFDLVGALVALILFAVPMLMITVLVRCALGSPVLFRQERPGLRGKPFTLYKFRSMKTALKGRENEDDAARITLLGRLLRRSSLDELPELYNVIVGDMSLVGPRPLLMEYLPRYTPEQARRHQVKPGITGWAQVKGRNSLTWEEKFELDVWYVDHANLFLDLKILCLTVCQVWRRDGIEAPGHASAPKFKGSPVNDS